MKLYVLPIPKDKLDIVPQAEKAFYIHAGHLRNELMVTLKILKASINKPSDDPILTHVRVAQTFYLSRMLAGKIWEGWDLVKRSYLNKKLRPSIENYLSPEAKLSFKELEEYFAKKKNVINLVRNRFAFHYDPSLIEKQLESVDESDKLAVYVGEKEANIFYQMSEITASKAMLDAIEHGNFEAANRKLMNDVTVLSRHLIKFCDGCLLRMTDAYFGTDRIALNPEEVEIAEVPSRDEITLPFFTE
jgi:hypothetical protein